MNKISGWDPATSIFFKRFYFLIYFLERRKSGEKDQCMRQTSMGCLLPTPGRGPDPQSRHVPWPGIEQVTFWFTGQLVLNPLSRTSLGCHCYFSEFPMWFQCTVSLANFSWKWPHSKYFCFGGEHTVSLATTHLCLWSRKTATDSISESAWLCYNKTLFTKDRQWLHWPVGPSFQPLH